MEIEAERLAELLWTDAARLRSAHERRQAARLARIMSSPDARELILALTDEVLRVRDPARAAALLSGLADPSALSAFGSVDRAALRTGASIGPAVPALVVPAARRRVEAEMAGVVLAGRQEKLRRRTAQRHRQGFRLNINLLGEAVLGEEEAERRLAQLVAVLAQPWVEYVSVKISSICSQLDVLAFEHEAERISGRLRRLYRAAAAHSVPKFVNLDMEEYRDLDLTLAVFQRVLDEPEFATLGAGIVLQAYLPDSVPALEELCAWAGARHRRSGGWIKVRIVKGANMAMERVEAELHGWPAAPFDVKSDTDANYKRMLELVLAGENARSVRLGVASHNVFEIAWAAVRAAEEGALERVDFEMLEGMSPALSQAVAARLGGVLLYEPVVDPRELDTAIAYLVRRLDENGAPENFLSHQFSLAAGTPEWEDQAGRFRQSVIDKDRPAPPSRRTQDRSVPSPTAAAGRTGFVNEPDTDFTMAANRKWATQHLEAAVGAGWPTYRPVVDGKEVSGDPAVAGVDPSRPGRPAYRWIPASTDTAAQAVAVAAAGGSEWADRPVAERSRILMNAAQGLADGRGRLLAVMAVDTGKTLREGDPEVSEAVDFAHYYARQIPAPGSGFRPYGTVVVASPWNFPLSIPAGGVLAALAAGNAVILKPAPEAVAVAGELARILWESGVPGSALQFLPCTDGDASRLLITSPDVNAVVLTGSWDTAQMFREWRPDLDLHAETSGKNAIVVSATADPDQAIADLVHSAFGHAGQKCSAASLAIVEASVFDDGRFLRRLADAVRSLRPGPAWDTSTTMGPLIRPPDGPLRRALESLEDGERWLVQPRRLDGDGYLWSPAVKTGVEPGSPFHLTECFGPVLGVMRAPDLETALAWQNQPAYGLTAGLQALDPAEVEWWREEVQAGNLYVNRGITGAIVGRQPFGGWKRSVVGPGAKAGGPNYVASLGHWEPAAGTGAGAFGAACRAAWAEMQVPRDPSGLRAESNSFRYRPTGHVGLVRSRDADPEETDRAMAAAAAVGVRVTVSDSIVAADKIRLIGPVDAAVRRSAVASGVWLDDSPVSADPSREVLRWVREQAISESRHRHGNVTRRRPGLA